MESCSSHPAGHLPGCRTGDSDALGTSILFASPEHPHGLCWPYPPSCPTLRVLLLNLESSGSSCLWIRTTQKERALEQQIPLGGKITPGNLLGKSGHWRPRGTLHSGVGWGGKDQDFPAPPGQGEAQCSQAVGRHRLAPLPVGSCGCQAQGWDNSAAPGAGVVRDGWAGSQRCISTRKLQPLGPCGFGRCSCDVGQPQSPLPAQGASQLWRGAGEGGSEPGWARQRGRHVKK